MAKKKTKSQEQNKYTLQQRIEIFAQAIVEGQSQSDAYRLAYPNSKKWKNETIHNEASKFMKKDEVSTRVAELSQEATKDHKHVITKIMERLECIALLDLRDLYDDKGNLLPIHKLPKDVAAAISSFEVTANGKTTHKVKTWDINRAIELIGKFHNIWTTNHVHSGPGGGPIPVANMEITSELSGKEASQRYKEFMNNV